MIYLDAADAALLQRPHHTLGMGDGAGDEKNLVHSALLLTGHSM